MTTPQPPLLTPEERLALEQRNRYDNITRNLAIGGAIICPIIMVLPPRKLDLYTFSLGVGFYLSADHLAQSYTGRALYQQFLRRDTFPTEKARENSRILKERQQLEAVKRDGKALVAEKSLLQRVWMGDEEEGWKERRLEEEKRALAEGKSYGSMILEQIWDVWNWDKGDQSGKSGSGSVEGQDGTKNE